MDSLELIHTFREAVRRGSFSGAARALDMSPAVITRLVADLETHLGTRLLHRSTRRLSLSVAGETYRKPSRTHTIGYPAKASYLPPTV